MARMDDTNDMDTSHKGKTLRNYTASFKSKVICHAKQFTISSAACNFNVDRRMVAHWVNNHTQLQAQATEKQGKNKKRLPGGGRKPLNEELDQVVLEWTLDRRSKGLRFSQTLIRKKLYFGPRRWVIQKQNFLQAQDGVIDL